ncbi:hypothetical protein JAO29_20480 [Edaphobacter sp. HDX4]|uniref:hypothetical protein n=1 Tax=Edaphobacter sp. HDX4 TaxID=2794064 RepID=UPI002FE600B6
MSKEVATDFSGQSTTVKWKVVRCGSFVPSPVITIKRSASGGSSEYAFDVHESGLVFVRHNDERQLVMYEAQEGMGEARKTLDPSSKRPEAREE